MKWIRISVFAGGRPANFWPRCDGIVFAEEFSLWQENGRVILAGPGGGIRISKGYLGVPMIREQPSILQIREPLPRRTEVICKKVSEAIWQRIGREPEGTAMTQIIHHMALNEAVDMEDDGEIYPAFLQCARYLIAVKTGVLNSQAGHPDAVGKRLAGQAGKKSRQELQQEMVYIAESLYLNALDIIRESGIGEKYIRRLSQIKAMRRDFLKEAAGKVLHWYIRRKLIPFLTGEAELFFSVPGSIEWLLAEAVELLERGKQISAETRRPLDPVSGDKWWYSFLVDDEDMQEVLCCAEQTDGNCCLSSEAVKSLILRIEPGSLMRTKDISFLKGMRQE